MSLATRVAAPEVAAVPNLLPGPGSQSLLVLGGERHFDVFWTENDGAIWTRWWDNGNWGDTFPITDPGSAPEGASLSGTHRNGRRAADIFWMRDDGTGMIATSSGGKPWKTSTVTVPNMGPGRASVACASIFDNHLDAFWVDHNGTVLGTWWDANANSKRWNVPYPLSPPNWAPPGAAVTAVPRLGRDGQRIDIFWVSHDGTVWSNWWDGNVNAARWNRELPISGPGSAAPGAPVAAVSREFAHLEAFWVGDDGAVRGNWKNDGSGGEWMGVFGISDEGDAPAGAGISAVSYASDELNVFWINTDGVLATASWHGEWGRPFVPAGSVASPPGGPLSAARIGDDGLIIIHKANGKDWTSAFWHETGDYWT